MRAQTKQAKILKGTFRPSRGQTPADLTPDTPLPMAAPSWLSRAAKGHYNRLRPQLDGIATAKDVDTLAAFCQDLFVYRKLSRQAVNIADLIEVTKSNTERPSAIVRVQNTIAARLLKNAKALCLTPESRGYKPPEPDTPEPDNPWDAV